MTVLVWLLAAGWLRNAWQWARHLGELPDLTLAKWQETALPPEFSSPEKLTPSLTVVVPACNEAAAIEATLLSLLAQTGIRLQIVAVDDRSMDATGAIMDRIADRVANEVRNERNPQHSLKVLHIQELPTGWLGKPHALATAAAQAQAEWILFTDGDVLFAPEALSRALRYVQAEPADHLVLMPDWITGSWDEAAMHGAMHALTTWTLRLWRVADPRAKDFLGVGAFNLIRRSAYESLGGFTALRMEVLEDLRLGWMVKRAGLRQRVALGPGLVSVRWAHGAWGVVKNLEKNLFALYRFNTPLALLAAAGLLVQIALPLAAFFLPGWARWGGIAVYAAILAVYLASQRATRVPWVYFLAFPAATGLFLFAFLRSIVLGLVRQGVVWRGTRYSLKELRANAGKFW